MKFHLGCLSALIGAVLTLSACGGGGGSGGNGSSTEIKPADTGASTPSPLPPSPSPSSPDPSTPATPPPAPTVTIDMPAIYTPSQNMQLVFLQDGKERKIRYEDGIQVVSVVSGKTFEMLIPDHISYQLFTSITLQSSYIPGSEIPLGGNVMARGYEWEENAEIGWDLNLGFFGRSFNSWYDNELPSTDKGYKVLKVKAVNHGRPLPVDIDLLVYSPKSPWISYVPRINEYEVLKLRMLPADTAGSAAQ